METFTIDISDVVNNATDKGLPDPSLLQLYRDIERRTFIWNDEVSDEILTLADYIMTYNFEDKDVEPESVFLSKSLSIHRAVILTAPST